MLAKKNLPATQNKHRPKIMGLREYWVSGEFVSDEREYAGDPIITETKINESPGLLGLQEYWVSVGN